jgi:hypothetical protein
MHLARTLQKVLKIMEMAKCGSMKLGFCCIYQPPHNNIPEDFSPHKDDCENLGSQKRKLMCPVTGNVVYYYIIY